MRSMRQARGYYPKLVAALRELDERDTGYARVGALCLGADEGALDAIERVVRRRAEASAEAGEISRLRASEARALFPPLRPGLGAVSLSGGARVDGRKITASLLAAAERLGALRREGAAALEVAGGAVRGVRLGEERLAAECVVATAGAWAPALLKPFGRDLAIAPQRGQIVHLRLPGQETGAWPVVLPMSSYYLLAFADERVVVGATRENHVGFDYRVTAGGLAEVLAEALRVAPGLADATLLETRVGFRPVGPDHRPMLGGVPGIARLLIGNGLGAAGLTIGPFAGRMLAEIALGQMPEIDLSPFAPSWGDAGMGAGHPALR